MKYTKEENYKKISQKIKNSQKKPFFYGSVVLIILLGLGFLSFQKKEIFFANEIWWNKVEEIPSSSAFDVCGFFKKTDLTAELPWLKQLKLPSNFVYQEYYRTDCDGTSPLQKKHYEIHGKLEDKVFQMSIGTLNRGLSDTWCCGGIAPYLVEMPKSWIHKEEVVLLESENRLVANFYNQGYWVTIRTEHIAKEDFLLFLTDFLLLKKE